jgi:hypothetical protein
MGTGPYSKGSRSRAELVRAANVRKMYGSRPIRLSLLNTATRYLPLRRAAWARRS